METLYLTLDWNGSFYTVDEFFDYVDFPGAPTGDDFIRRKTEFAEEVHCECPDSRLIEVLERYPELWEATWCNGVTVMSSKDRIEVCQRMVRYLMDRLNGKVRL